MASSAPLRILVVRALQLGDLLCAVPALRALRHWQPNAHITLCGLPWSRDFVSRYSHLLDDFLEFPGYPGIPEVPFATATWNTWLDAVRGQYDLIIQLHGSGPYINDFVRALEPRQSAGFYPTDRPELALDQGCAWPESGHEIERLNCLMYQLGVENLSTQLELPVASAEIKSARAILELHGLKQSTSYVCLHVGGRSLTRRWPLEKYAIVADELLGDGLAVVLTGTAAEADLSERLQQLLSQRCINLVARTNWGQLIGLIDQARLLLSNDTGVSHIAAARQTPSVVIGLGSDLARWLPIDRQLHRAVYVEVTCRPCYDRNCPTQFECASGVTPKAVLSAVRRQLDHRNAQNLPPETCDGSRIGGESLELTIPSVR